jgi:peptidoglycan/xylan/chitin deacetylase (PgdA/CDA1 family)
MEDLVINFHGIGDIPDFVPGDERPYWISEREFQNFVKGTAEVTPDLGIRIIVTFDDGNRSDIDIAAVILAKYKVNGIFFPCTGRIWNPNYLNAEHIRSLDDAGFEVGSHGIDHRRWKGLPSDSLEREVKHSKLVLEDILGKKVVSAALPFGSYDAASLEVARSSGYRVIYSSDAGMSKDDAFFRRRWTYHAATGCDIVKWVHLSRSINHQVISGLKHFIKARL